MNIATRFIGGPHCGAPIIIYDGSRDELLLPANDQVYLYKLKLTRFGLRYVCKGRVVEKCAGR